MSNSFFMDSKKYQRELLAHQTASAQTKEELDAFFRQSKRVADLKKNWERASAALLKSFPSDELTRTLAAQRTKSFKPVLTAELGSTKELGVLIATLPSELFYPLAAPTFVQLSGRKNHIVFVQENRANDSSFKIISCFGSAQALQKMVTKFTIEVEVANKAFCESLRPGSTLLLGQVLGAETPYRELKL